MRTDGGGEERTSGVGPKKKELKRKTIRCTGARVSLGVKFKVKSGKEYLVTT